jgi:hypothetical protein
MEAEEEDDEEEEGELVHHKAVVVGDEDEEEDGKVFFAFGFNALHFLFLSNAAVSDAMLVHLWWTYVYLIIYIYIYRCLLIFLI